jgi:hypothetical protein
LFMQRRAAAMAAGSLTGICRVVGGERSGVLSRQWPRRLGLEAAHGDLSDAGMVGGNANAGANATE